MNQYRTNGVMFYVPRRKNELVDMIIKSGWNGTKTALIQKERKELVAILYRFRNEFFTKMMTIDKPNS